MVVNRGREAWKTYNNVFDQFTITNLERMQDRGFFDELESSIALGKEANIFIARKGSDQIIIKIYRLENVNFNQMTTYLRQDPRYERIGGDKRKIVFAWTQREYRNLLIARETIRVPTPIFFFSNIILMEMIGEPAPKVKDQIPKDPAAFEKEIYANMDKLWKGGLVHGDLSSFNILNFDEKPVFIDFSQSTVTQNAQAKSLFERDKKNIADFFVKIKRKNK
ncbi:MAG: serine protein kinase RIO [Candidatus Woesearchaeota archaeon]|nr:MAG: serine protein kinase RIO [Candidatus Woesearchaeota archaeon]